MTIARLPNRHPTATNEPKAKSFIEGAGKHEDQDTNRVPVQLRIRGDILERIDREARRRGITRTAFMISTMVKELGSVE